MAGMELVSCSWCPFLHRPAQARHYPAGLKINYVTEIFFASSSLSYSFIPSLSPPNDHHTKSNSFQGITFIYTGRYTGFCDLYPSVHPNILVSLQCPNSLSFSTPLFSLTSGFVHLYQLSPHSPTQHFFYWETTDLCVTQSWHLHLHSFYSTTL